jgi:hypothetical protein
MKENSRNAQNALNASIEASELDQRAWLGLSDHEILQYDPSDTTKPFRMQVFFRNSGKTPARQVLAEGTFQVYKTKGEGPTDVDWSTFIGFFNQHKASYRYVVAPNTSRKILTDGSVDQPETKGINKFIMDNSPAIKQKTIFLHYFGQATYLDIDNRFHTIRFCLWLPDPDTRQFYFCAKGNDMD